MPRHMRTSLALAAGSFLFAAGSASGALIGLTPGTPDVFSGFVTVTYNATTDRFVADGQTQNMNPGGAPMGGRTFHLECSIDSAGVASGPASLLVRGDVGGTDQVLFSSSLMTQFGFGTVDTLEFVFYQQGGNLAPVGSWLGTILNMQGTFPGGMPSFTNDFTNVVFPGFPGTATADTFVIPAPSATLALGLGILGATRRRSR